MTTDQATPASTTTETATPSSVTTTSTVKPGWKTSEFYLALAAKILSGMFAFGLVGDGSTIARLAGVAGFVLTQLGYTVSRTLIKTAAPTVLFCLFLAHSQTGCATSSRNKGLGASVATLDAAEVGLHAYCHQHTEDIIAAAPKTEDGQIAARNEIDELRAKCDHAQQDIDGAYRVSTAAGVANDDPSLAKVRAVVQAIVAELATVGVKL